nr:hypothetical protein CFP56_62291 [Quercus suber]
MIADMATKDSWAIFYQGKVIPMGVETINWTRRDPTEIWGWFKLELAQAWKNMFPLTDLSKRLVYLPLKDETYMLTPNPWWRFLTDWPAVLVPPQISSGSSTPRSSVHPLEKLLSEAEVKWTHPVIIIRKILQDRPVEYIL